MDQPSADPKPEGWTPPCQSPEQMPPGGQQKGIRKGISYLTVSPFSGPSFLGLPEKTQDNWFHCASHQQPTIASA